MQFDYSIILTKQNLHINDKSNPYKDCVYIATNIKMPGIRQMVAVASNRPISLLLFSHFYTLSKATNI